MATIAFCFPSWTTFPIGMEEVTGNYFTMESWRIRIGRSHLLTRHHIMWTLI